MKSILRDVRRSPKFMIGFGIMVFVLLFCLIYPFFNPGNPLEMVGTGTFFRPGTYVSLYDSVDPRSVYTLKLTDAQANRVVNKLSDDDKAVMAEWLIAFGIPEEDIDLEETEEFLQLWWDTYDEEIRIPGMISAKRKHVARVDKAIDGLLESEDVYVMAKTAEGDYDELLRISDTDYVNVKEVANVKRLPLGTDNFGRDMLKQMVSACKTSLLMGLAAGLIATLIGLTLGLLAGYVGGVLDDIIMFITNLFTVIPSFVLVILISFSIGQENRGAFTVAVVIGLTSWVWTARSVRAQVVSLRNRDHVNLSKLSGHSLVRIVCADILPYIASYVVMAFILQVSAAILAEAQLSMLGLGPKTTTTPTLGIMMKWGISYMAHLNGAWWAYFPIIMLIALISFALNLMNTGLDQVFNPQLRS